MYRDSQPWVADHPLAPKSVVRDMWEQAMTFAYYVQHYQLARAEGTLLRYLSGAYKALVQTVPETATTDELSAITEWLGQLVHQVASSQLDEWQAPSHPEEVLEPHPDTAPPDTDPRPAPPTRERRATWCRHRQNRRKKK